MAAAEAALVAVVARTFVAVHSFDYRIDRHPCVDVLLAMNHCQYHRKIAASNALVAVDVVVVVDVSW